MKRPDKNDLINCIALCLLAVIVALLITRFKYEYGSDLDWETQHYEIPESFRTHFYQTHDLFPDFIANIGAGQNIYNYSYYGLYSPIILLSYLLPFVSMETYIQVISFLGVIASVLLCYYWLRSKYSSKITFFATFLFECASPLLLHSHRHIMFVNYMPFLVLALIGVDAYYKSQKKALLVFSTFLMIMTSYFFSVGGIMAITIYAIAVYIKTLEKHTFKSFIVAALKYAGLIMTSIMMSAILLFPTIISLLSGRSETNSDISLRGIILPSFNGDFILYSTYSVGMTSIIIVAIIYGFLSEMRHLKFTSTVLGLIIMIPTFTYALNGTMYVDGKVLIPLLPLCAYLIGSFSDKMENGVVKVHQLIKWTLIVNLFLIICYEGSAPYLYVLDLLITLFVIYETQIKKKKWYFGVIMLIALVSCIVVNLNDRLVEKNEKTATLINEAKEDAQYVMENNTDSYRTANAVKQVRNMNKYYGKNYLNTTIYSSVCNGYYKNFYYNEICNENPYRNAAMLCHPNNLMFDIYMGEKYLIATNDTLIPMGYELVYENDNTNVYVNKDVFSLGYVKTDMISESEYDKLEYPYNVLALLKYCVVSDDTYGKYSKEDKDFESEISNYFIKRNVDDFYKNAANVGIVNNNTVKVKLEEPDDFEGDRYFVDVDFKLDNKEIDKDKNNILFLSLKADNSMHKEPSVAGYGLLRNNANGGSSSFDVIITANKYKNKLTNPNWKYYNNNTDFHYCISNKKNVKKIKLSFFDGEYEVSDIAGYSLDYDEIKKIKKEHSELIIDSDSVGTDRITGKIDARNSGIFMISFPYDKGFVVKVDGNETEYEMVDKAFVGFYLEKGEHDISIEYKAPLKDASLAISILGILVFVAIAVSDRIIKKSVRVLEE